MTSEDLATRIQRTYAKELAAIHRRLAADRTETARARRTLSATSEVAWSPIPAVLNLDSLTSWDTVLTIVVDLDQEPATPHNTVQTSQHLTISIAAHHYRARITMPLDITEATAWAQAIAGPTWRAGPHPARTVNGTTPTTHPAPTHTQYFHMTIDAETPPVSPASARGGGVPHEDHHP